jgi:hypothetical protein
VEPRWREEDADVAEHDQIELLIGIVLRKGVSLDDGMGMIAEPLSSKPNRLW